MAKPKLTDKLKVWYLKTTNGMNNKVENLELGDKFVTNAQNCRFEEDPGAATKRPPVAYYNSTSKGAGATVGLYRFYTSGGTIKSILVHGTVAYVGDDTAGTWTSIRSGLTSTKQTSFVVYKDILMAGNGTDNIWCYDGSDDVTWELGACKAVLASGGSNLDSAAAYSYKITIDAEAYICGAVSNTVTTDASNRKVTLTNIPLGPSGTADRIIYRTEGGGSTYYKIATISDNSTTTYTDDIADTTATAMGAVTDDFPIGSILVTHRERLFISGNASSNINRIYYSNPYLPGFIQGTTNTDYMNVAQDDGDKITGLAIHMGVMLCIKRNTIRKLHVSAATSGQVPATWYADDPFAFSGSPSQWSVIQTPFGIVYLGWDGWYLFDGGSLKRIITQFDSNEILSGRYADVVTHYNKGTLYASYTDIEEAPQYNNRVMVYNFARDSWGFDNLNINCFSSHNGDDESAELYYGDSVNGYVYKAEEGALWYRLYNKTQCNNGTATDTYVGGTESSPLIQIGSNTSATEIPDDICIFWEDPDSNPGSGWTEITAAADYFVKITTDAVATTGGTAAHTHAITGDLLIESASYVNSGDGSANATNQHHVHTISGTSDSTTPEPTHTKLRIFKKNDTTTEYVFPDGAICMWDQTTAPTGWVLWNTTVGSFIKNQTTALGATVYGSHAHTFTFTSSVYSQSADSEGTGTATNKVHSHEVSGTTNSAIDTAWDMDNITFTFIKKIGEEDTWDGTSKYLYAIYHAATAPGGDWTDVTSTHTGRYLKVGDNGLESNDMSSTGSITVFEDATGGQVKVTAAAHGMSTGDSVVITLTTSYNGTFTIANAETDTFEITDTWVADDGTGTWTHDASGKAHTHSITDFASGDESASGGNGGYQNQGIAPHTHTVEAADTNTDRTDPQYYTFRLCKIILGKMLDYNAALTVHQGTGIWESPGKEITASTMGNMYFNVTGKGASDTVQVFTKTGSSQSAVEDMVDCTAANATETFTDNDHGLANADRIVLDGTVPTGTSDSTMYYVVGKTTNTFQVSLTSGGAAVAFTTDGTSVTYKKWDGPLADSNAITSSAATWIAYMIVFTAADTTAANGKVYFENSYLLKFDYEKSGTTAETAVEWIYELGFKNFDAPMVDKIFKKIASVHSGTQGDLIIKWETDNGESGQFTIDLSANKESWDSFFPSTAYGQEIKITAYKNDLFDITLKELKGLYTPRPILV